LQATIGVHDLIAIDKVADGGDIGHAEKHRQRRAQDGHHIDQPELLPEQPPPHRYQRVKNGAAQVTTDHQLAAVEAVHNGAGRDASHQGTNAVQRGDHAHLRQGAGDLQDEQGNSHDGKGVADE
jgi:hypothetical protein